MADELGLLEETPEDELGLFDELGLLTQLPVAKPVAKRRPVMVDLKAVTGIVPQEEAVPEWIDPKLVTGIAPQEEAVIPTIEKPTPKFSPIVPPKRSPKEQFLGTLSEIAGDAARGGLVLGESGMNPFAQAVGMTHLGKAGLSALDVVDRPIANFMHQSARAQARAMGGEDPIPGFGELIATEEGRLTSGDPWADLLVDITAGLVQVPIPVAAASRRIKSMIDVARKTKNAKLEEEAMIAFRKLMSEQGAIKALPPAPTEFSGGPLNYSPLNFGEEGGLAAARQAEVIPTPVPIQRFSGPELLQMIRERAGGSTPAPVFRNAEEAEQAMAEAAANRGFNVIDRTGRFGDDVIRAAEQEAEGVRSLMQYQPPLMGVDQVQQVLEQLQAQRGFAIKDRMGQIQVYLKNLEDALKQVQQNAKKFPNLNNKPLVRTLESKIKAQTDELAQLTKESEALDTAAKEAAKAPVAPAVEAPLPTARVEAPLTSARMTDEVDVAPLTVADIEKGVPPSQKTLDSLPSNAKIAFERAWRPVQDTLRDHAPEIPTLITESHRESEKFAHVITTRLLNAHKKLTSAVGRGQKNLVTQALVHKLNGSDLKEIPDEVKVFLDDPRVEEAAANIRKIMDEVHAETKNPRVKAVIGDVGYIENYFPWATKDTPESAFSHAVKTTVEEGAKGKYVRDLDPKGYKTRFFNTRKGGKLHNFNFEEVMHRYVEGVRKTLFDVVAYDEAKKLATAYPEDTGLRKLIDNFLDYYVGAPSTKYGDKTLSKLVDEVNANTYAATLGLPNVMTPLRNFNQIINLAVKANPIHTAKGIIHMKRGIKELNDLGVFREVPGLEHYSLSVGTLRGTVRDAFMKGFQATEKMLRGASYEAGKSQALARGLANPAKRATKWGPTNLERAGLDMVDMTQYSYSKVNPVSMSHHPIMKLFMVLGSYPLRTSSFVYDMIKDIGRAKGAVAKAEKAGALSAWMVSQGLASKAGIGIGSLLMGESPALQWYRGVSDIGNRFSESSTETNKQRVLKSIADALALQAPGGVAIKRHIENATMPPKEAREKAIKKRNKNRRRSNRP